MIGKLLRGAGRRHGTRPFFVLCTTSALATAMVSAAPAAAQSPPYFNEGLRWIGLASKCTAPLGWTAERLFHTPQPPAALANFCLYTWTSAVQGPPAPAQISALFTASGAQGMTEDVPVVSPAAPFSAEEEALFAGLRTALRAQVGDASLLPVMPARPLVRVVVIDSAPDARHGQIQLGASRHGDTLAHLIEDIVCQPAGDQEPGRTCAAEVTTQLALPWIARGVPGANGGHMGTLSDLARAIERAVSTWQDDLRAAPFATPGRLLLNLSLGWEHTPGIADCSTEPPELMGAPARAVRAILQYAASQGALIVAAAGNDSGGPEPRSGLICPGRYQAVPQEGAPSRSLVVAASGVDYQDHPLETARPGGIAGLAGLGLGGVAWQPGDPAPPQLVGSSVSAAVVSAASALVWAHQPSWTPGQVTAAVYHGGTDVGAADACPLSLPLCRSHRVSVCGALQAAGAPPSCTPPAPKPWSCPALPAEIAALAAAYASVPPSTGTLVPLATIPRYAAPTVQTEPSVFPQPISGTCPTCWVGASSSPAPYLLIPALGQSLQQPVLVVRFADMTLQALALGPLTMLASSTPYAFTLPPTWGPIQSAYITGFDLQLYSVTEQIFVQP